MGAHIWKAPRSLRSKRLPGPELPWSPAGGLEADARVGAHSIAPAQVVGLRPERWPRRVPPLRGSLTAPLGP